LDPYSVHVSGGLLHSTFWAGRYDETIAEGRRILALVPKYSTADDFTGLAYSHQDKHAEAISTLEEARKLTRDDPTTLGHLGYVCARAGKRAEAEKVLAELEALPTRPYFSPRLPAMVYAALGKNDDAFRWLRKARDEMDTWFVFLKVDRTFENLHDDPRFAQLLHDMGLPP
jgi:Flp pilus assembly protein TadD